MMKLRQATLQDAEAIRILIHPYIHDFAVNIEGEQKFSIETICQLIHTPELYYWLLEDKGRLKGVIAYKKPAHLIHFFVDSRYQKQGLGRYMWNFVEEKLKLSSESMSVNSSEYAVPIYQKMGFKVISDVAEAYGLRFVKMQKDFSVH